MCSRAKGIIEFLEAVNMERQIPDPYGRNTNARRLYRSVQTQYADHKYDANGDGGKNG